MSLATRCTACGTIFRVVQDQLKVSDGWVRCGRCQEVFNAQQNLFDLERETPPPWPPTASEGWDSTQQQPSEFPSTASLLRSEDPGGDEPPLSTADVPQRRPVEVTADGADSVQPGDFADARFNLDLLDTDARTAVVSLPPESATAPPAAPIGDIVLPTFVRQADRAARWRHPAVRAGLVVVALLAALALAAQAALQFREGLATDWPPSRALLEPLCALAGCRIEPPRRLDALVVDSSGLVKVDEAGLYRLNLVLHNRSAAPVRLPAIDLALTDAAGRLVARRALLPAELGLRQDSLAGGAELPLQAVLATGDGSVVGYTVEIFYP